MLLGEMFTEVLHSGSHVAAYEAGGGARVHLKVAAVGPLPRITFSANVASVGQICEREPSY